MADATNYPKVQIFPESQTKFFLKDVDAQIEFIANNNGKIKSFILNLGGQKINGKKKKENEI
jgi:hypothetical protein